MKMVTAYIKPFKLNDVHNALHAIGVSGITVCEAKGHGHAKGHCEVLWDTEFVAHFISKIRLEVIIPDPAWPDSERDHGVGANGTGRRWKDRRNDAGRALQDQQRRHWRRRAMIGRLPLDAEGAVGRNRAQGWAMRLSILVGGLLFATAASAQKIPNVDIQNYCRSKSVLGGGSDEFYAACVEGETVTLGELRENWNDYSAESRSQCLKITGSGGVYSDLQACIEAAEAIRDTKRR